MIFLNILGGVALILFGVRYLSKGLDRLFGQKLTQWMHRMTEHRLKAFFAGIGISMLAPSSTTLALVSLNMLEQGQLKARQMMAVILGTNIGITVTVQLLAFRVYDYYPIFLIIGLIGFQFLKRNVFRGIGQCILALGFIFLAMDLISNAATNLSQNGDLVLIIQILHDQPLALILATAMVTIMVQSSTATLGIGLALVNGGLGGLNLLIPIVIGANIGIAGTTFIAGLPSLEGRRLGIANLLLKGGFAIVCLFALIPIIEIFQDTPGNVVRQGANFHTLFNVMIALIGLPMVGSLNQIVRFMIKPDHANKDGSLTAPTSYLDDDALVNPFMGLINATRETMSMADGTKTMLTNFWKAYEDDDIELARQVQKYDDKIDLMNTRIKEYLSQLNEDAMEPKEIKLQYALLNFSSELEAIGDIIDKNLCHQLLKEVKQNLVISDQDQQNLTDLYNELIRRFETAISILASRDSNLAGDMLAGKENFNEWCRKVQKIHYENLGGNDVVSLKSSSYFIDMLNSLRKISSHLTSIAYSFQPPRSDE
ncbi:MAG: Na/Pi cotransporter family protein [Balneolales bacterium]